MTQTTKYETGATSHAVNDLVLFVDNTRILAEKRDEIYTQCMGDEHRPSCYDFGPLLRMATEQYKKEFGYANSIHIIQLTHYQSIEFGTLYASEFDSWKKEHGFS